MDRNCKKCGEKFHPSKLLVYNDGTFLCEGCCPSITKDPLFLNLQLFWYEAIALEKILDGEIDLELMEIRDNILKDLRETIRKILKGIVNES